MPTKKTSGAAATTPATKAHPAATATRAARAPAKTTAAKPPPPAATPRSAKLPEAAAQPHSAARKLAAAQKLAQALVPEPAATQVPGGKLAVLVELLQRQYGASIAEMMDATGWQAHSIRGAMAGALKKKGYTVTSDKPGRERIYKIVPPAPPALGRRSRGKAAG